MIPELSDKESNKEPLLKTSGHHYSIFEDDPDRTSELIKSMKLTDHKKRTCYLPSYRPPEVTLEFDYSTWADIYALGCLLYQLASLSTMLPENLDDLQIFKIDRENDQKNGQQNSEDSANNLDNQDIFLQMNPSYQKSLANDLGYFDKAGYLTLLSKKRAISIYNNIYLRFNKLHKFQEAHFKSDSIDKYFDDKKHQWFEHSELQRFNMMIDYKDQNLDPPEKTEATLEIRFHSHDCYDQKNHMHLDKNGWNFLYMSRRHNIDMDIRLRKSVPKINPAWNFTENKAKTSGFSKTKNSPNLNQP